MCYANIKEMKKLNFKQEQKLIKGVSKLLKRKRKIELELTHLSYEKNLNEYQEQYIVMLCWKKDIIEQSLQRLYENNKKNFEFVLDN